MLSKVEHSRAHQCESRGDIVVVIIITGCLWWAGINASRCFQIQVWPFFIVKHTQSLRSSGLVYTKHQRQSCDNSAMMLEILSSLKTKESLGNGLQPPFWLEWLLFSMRTVLLVLSHSHWPIPNGLNWTVFTLIQFLNWIGVGVSEP